MPSQQLNDIKTRSHATMRSIVALILREMSTRYGDKPGGYIWAVLEPLGAIVIMSIAFSLLLRSPSLGNSFILIYAAGFLPFSIYQAVSNMVARSLNFSRPLLFYPSVTWLDAILARAILNMLTGFLITYLLLFGIIMMTDTAVVLKIVPLFSAMVLAALLGFGIGCMNCFLMGLIPTWDIVWAIATRPLFIISGVIFIYEDMPRNIQSILWYNPLMHITGLMRTGVYPMYSPDYISYVYVLGFALLPTLLGLLLLRRYYRDILNA